MKPYSRIHRTSMKSGQRHVRLEEGFQKTHSSLEVRTASRQIRVEILQDPVEIRISLTDWIFHPTQDNLNVFHPNQPLLHSTHPPTPAWPPKRHQIKKRARAHKCIGYVQDGDDGEGPAPGNCAAQPENGKEERLKPPAYEF